MPARSIAKRIEELRQAQVYGLRPMRSFREAATKYLLECQKATVVDDARRLNGLDPFIGDLRLETVHNGTLRPFIDAKRAGGIKTRTINHYLQVVRHVLNLAAQERLDEYGLTWLASAPKIKFIPEHDLRKPYPISWEEQERLFKVLPVHLARMALFKVNTGCRDAEVSNLRWRWETAVPELNTSVFIIPAYAVKNRSDRLVVLNRVAKSVGRRLRAAGVSFEDRQDLLGHKSCRITTHYSAAELGNLIESANRVCGDESRKSPALILLRGNA